jgi:hypothetical protein
MADNETPVQSALFMDRDSSLGNSEDTFLRRALHVKVGNKTSEPIPTSEQESQNLKITNHTTSVTPGTELAIPLTPSVKEISIRARNGSRLRYSFTLGQSNVQFWTIARGNVESISGVSLVSYTLYINASLPSEVIELRERY